MNRLFAIVVFAFVLIAASLTWAQDKPNPKAQILSPKADQVLTGNVEVRLTLPPKLASPVYAGLGGPPWVKLEKAANADEWIGQLNSRMVPNGGHNLIVRTTNKRADAAVSVKVANELSVYFSDLHSHTRYSDGTLLPVAAHDYARNISKLDVFSLTDHLE